MKQGAKAEARKASKYAEEVSVVPEHTLDTTVRVDYQKPSYKQNLNGKTTRYGCNGKRVAPAVGVGKCVNFA